MVVFVRSMYMVVSYIMLFVLHAMLTQCMLLYTHNAWAPPPFAPGISTHPTLSNPDKPAHLLNHLPPTTAALLRPFVGSSNTYKRPKQDPNTQASWDLRQTHVWVCADDIAYDWWVRGLAAMMLWYVRDPLLGACRGIASMKTEVAELVLPLAFVDIAHQSMLVCCVCVMCVGVGCCEECHVHDCFIAVFMYRFALCCVPLCTLAMHHSIILQCATQSPLHKHSPLIFCPRHRHLWSPHHTLHPHT